MKFKTLLGLIGGWMVSLGCARAEGQWEQSLNGPWQFATTAEAATWDTITVPGNWDTLPAYSTHSGKGWYSREFVTPPAASIHIASSPT